MFEIRPTAGLFGADVIGADLNQPLDAEAAKMLVDAIVQHHVLRIRQQNLSDAAYAALGPIFGDPIRFVVANDRDTQFPELIRIANSPTMPEFQRDGAAFWHTDGTYEQLPVTTTMLYAMEAPHEGGETLFADLSAAYEALPVTMRERIERLQVTHRMSGGKRFAYEKQISEEGIAYGKSMAAQGRGAEVVTHPLVLRHPITGRKALYGIAGTSFGIAGMSDADGEALLTELKTHATQDRFRIALKAQTGDLLMWDCLSTIHSAVPIEYSDEPGHRRILRRLSVTGMPQPYRDLTAPFAAARQPVGA